MLQKTLPLTTTIIEFEFNTENTPSYLKIMQFRETNKVKTSPQVTDSIESNVQSVNMKNDQTRDLTVYNKVKSQEIFPITTHICK